MTLKEYTVQDLVCQDCKHIIRASPDMIEKYKLEKCKICYYPNGSKRALKLLWQCATCRQVCLDNQEHLCFCIPKHNNVVLKIEYPYKKNQTNPEMERRSEEINLAKTQRILAARVEAEKRKPIDRQERMEALLQKLVDQGEK